MAAASPVEPLAEPLAESLAEPLAGAARAVAGGLRLAVKVTPRAARAAILGPAAEADGAVVLKLSVTAPPEDGKANAAVVALLAKAWKLPKSTIQVVSGATDRRKVLLIEGEPAVLARHIAARMEKTLP